MLFYTLDPCFPDTIFSASVYVSVAGLDQEYRFLMPESVTLLIASLYAEQ
jgi:hypothetical protein